MSRKVGNGIIFEATMRDLWGNKLYRDRANTADKAKISEIVDTLNHAFGIDLRNTKPSLDEMGKANLERIKEQFKKEQEEISLKVKNFMQKH